MELLAMFHEDTRGMDLANWSTKASVRPNSPMDLRRIGMLVHQMAAMAKELEREARRIPTIGFSLLPVGLISYGSNFAQETRCLSRKP